ncbi:heptahelical transmembrane protein 4 [Selaginella moellendorffii]|nr:heptahelical transmembrane protein 4 [Selaginella moellendorffii]|eukprot:XP_002960615.2 heptahelical transmembrane protein 4 [Selaginella moellendorffii]
MSPMAATDRDECPGSPSKARRLLQKAYNLVDYHALPDYLRDNEYILKHYRVNWPLKQTILSMFSIHNETLNFWTHCVGFLLFVFLTINVILTVEIPTLVAELLHAPTARWPIYTFLGGAMFCLFSSSVAHLLGCHSERASYLLLRLDYAGIASLISTSFYPPVYYSFMCSPLWRNLYLAVITLLGVLAILVSLLPVFQTAAYRPVRAALFVAMGVSGVAPVVHKIFLHGNQPVIVLTTVYELFMGLFYGMGALVYVTRVPERWKPGRFDIAGHSHQLFHVLVVAGAYTHYRAGLLYLQWRHSNGCGMV